MNIECLADASSGARPVVLMHPVTPGAAQRLIVSIEPLTRGLDLSVRFDEMEGFRALDGVRLEGISGRADVGVHGGDGSYRCVLTPDQWMTVVGLLEPFTSVAPGRHAHQYLASGNADWIVSTDRSW